MLARVKLKGIDGGSHKRWIMWFNSMQREEPYQGLTCQEIPRNGDVPEKELGHRWCMAVVSSCGNVFGSVQQRAQPLSLVTSLIYQSPLKRLPV